MGGLGPMAGQNHHFSNYAQEKIKYAIDRYVNETNRLYGVLDKRAGDGRVWKCTLCYDRQKVGLVPACAKACPTDSIQFGDVAELQARAKKRVETLQARGVDSYLYGVDEGNTIGDLNAFFLLTERPEAYNLPERPVLPSTRQPAGYLTATFAGAWLAVAAFFIFKFRT